MALTEPDRLSLADAIRADVGALAALTLCRLLDFRQRREFEREFVGRDDAVSQYAFTCIQLYESIDSKGLTRLEEYLCEHIAQCE